MVILSCYKAVHSSYDIINWLSVNKGVNDAILVCPDRFSWHYRLYINSEAVDWYLEGSKVNDL